MKWGVVARHRPDDRKEAHQEGETRRPLGAVDYAFASPHDTVGTGLWIADGADWHPYDEDDKSNEVNPGADHVDAAYNQCRVHGDQAGYEQDEEQHQVDVPCLDCVAGMRNRRGGEDHIR